MISPKNSMVFYGHLIIKFAGMKCTQTQKRTDIPLKFYILKNIYTSVSVSIHAYTYTTHTLTFTASCQSYPEEKTDDLMSTEYNGCVSLVDKEYG